MESTRFPGKPMALISGLPMLGHVFERARLFKGWDFLAVATCNDEIMKYCQSNNWPSIMTGNQHERCFERVHEAATICGQSIEEDDVIVVVQGDEPMLNPQMIEEVVKPFRTNKDLLCTILGMDIIHEEQYKSVNVVKIVHDVNFNSLYFSRSPVPFAKNFSLDIHAKRIYGIFGFRWKGLQLFNKLPSSPLERIESCDSNRLSDHGVLQKVVPYPYENSFSVDTPEDLVIVERNMREDTIAKQYMPKHL